jgi:hypothetical protein
MILHRELYVVTRTDDVSPLFETLRHHEAADWVSIWNRRRPNDPVCVRPAAAKIEYDTTTEAVPT